MLICMHRVFSTRLYAYLILLSERRNPQGADELVNLRLRFMENLSLETNF